MNVPRFHDTPASAIGERVRAAVTVGGRTFHFDRPAALDTLFNHPAVRAAYAADEYIPYWADPWPAGRMLAEVVLKEPWDDYPGDRPIRVLELGCGLGLTGIAALSAGLRVTFSDIDEGAVRMAAENARLNGFHDFDTATFDLRSPPAGVTFPVVLGADVMYETRMTEPLVEFLDAVLAPDGVALIADPDRLSARPFHSLAARNGFAVRLTKAKVGEKGSQTKGYIYRVTRAG
jgi:predicted nicotinamide N-methyase